DADIEYLVRSGKLFEGLSRSSSPERPTSPTISFASNSSGDFDSDAENLGFDADDREGNPWVGKRRGGQIDDVPRESIGMAPGRTGVKGVIRDEREAQQIKAAQRQREIDTLRKRMEKANLGGMTYLEEERERRELEGLVEEEKKVRRDVLGRAKDGRFGHLREVGKAGFVGAVEREDSGVWVVVHLYDPSLDRCYDLDDTLSRLARVYPQTKFLRARAAALGFASKGPATKRHRSYSKQQAMPGRYIDDDDDDLFGNDEDTDEKTPYYDDEEEDDEVEVDTDMLPTLLVYRDGQLVHNWVRVDWEAGKAGVDDLLARHHVISSSPRGLPALWSTSNPDEDEDLIWSDEETSAPR
ncbi:thioredoxin-like protein, partial [Pisolithus marmoratus]